MQIEYLHIQGVRSSDPNSCRSLSWSRNKVKTPPFGTGQEEYTLVKPFKVFSSNIFVSVVEKSYMKKAINKLQIFTAHHVLIQFIVSLDLTFSDIPYIFQTLTCKSPAALNFKNVKKMNSFYSFGVKQVAAHGALPMLRKAKNAK